MKSGEWVFSLERLTDGFRLHNQGPFPQTDSKGVLWKAFTYFCPFTKVSACPGMRGKPCASRNPTRGYSQIICASKNMRRSRTKKHRANESALKMPADRRDSKTYFPIKLGEWAFSLERLTDSFRLHSQGPFPERIPKVSFGKPLLNAVLSRK